MHVADSAFGSFKLIPTLYEHGGTGTYSVAANVKKWLWQTLSDGLGIDEGRTAYAPPTDTAPSLLVSVFNVISEQTGNQHLIKTLATGWEFKFPEESEDVVVKVTSSRETPNGQLEFLTYLQDGSSEWKLGSAFFSDDGSINSSFLEFVSKEKLDQVLRKFSTQKLSELCKGQKKVGGGVKGKLIKRLMKIYIRTKVSYFTQRLSCVLTTRERLRSLNLCTSTELGTCRRVKTPMPEKFADFTPIITARSTDLIGFGTRSSIPTHTAIGEFTLPGVSFIKR